jgi:predicted component of type VI protein secretion system
MQDLWLEEMTGDPGDRHPAAGLHVARFPCVLGRETDCDLRLPTPLVSRHHCRFFLRDGAVWVEDLISRNGTFLNRERIGEARPLRDGDRLDVAYLPFRARLASPAKATEETVDHSVGCCRVLVVEDDPDAAETPPLLLSRLGHDVRVAHDGPEALR